MSLFHDREQQDPWSSIVDLMSAFALVLFLAVTFFIINYNRASEQLKKREVQLVQEKTKLKSSLVALKQKTTSLISVSRAKAQLQSDKQKLENDKQKLSQQNLVIQRQLALLQEQEKKNKAEKQRLLEEQQRILADREKLLADKKALSSEISKKVTLVKKIKDATQRQEQLLNRAKQSQQQCENKLKTIIEQRQKVLRSVAQAFSISQQTKRVASVGFDPKSGKFRLGGEVLFAEGKAELTAEGKRQLRFVQRSLDQMIKNPKARRLLSGIMVEGHTSSTGAPLANWRLASRRSLLAMQYILSLVQNNPRKFRQYTSLLFASAFGQYRPVRDASGRPNARRSRRIEIKILFKQQEQLRSILKTSP